MTENKVNVYLSIYLVLVFTGLFLLAKFVIPEDFPKDIFGLPSILVIAMVALIIVSPTYFLYWRQSESRTGDFLRIAGKLRWNYKKRPELPFLEVAAAGLNIQFNHPLKSYLIEGVTGKINDRSFVICDGKYSDGSGGTFNTYIYQTLFVVNINKADFPSFGLEPKTFVSSLHNILAGFEIKFSSHPGFSKQYFLYGNDETMVRRLFSKEVLSLLESENNLSVFGFEEHLVMYRKKRQCDPATVENEIKLLMEIAEGLLNEKEIGKSSNNTIDAPKSAGNDHSHQKRVKYW